MITIPFLLTAGLFAALAHHRAEQKAMAGAMASVQRGFAPAHTSFEVRPPQSHLTLNVPPYPVGPGVMFHAPNPVMSDGQAERHYGTVTMSQPSMASEARSPFFGHT